MSDENTPKLRLRPKLAGGPPPVTPPQENGKPAVAPAQPEPPSPPAVPAPPQSAAPSETKPVVLRPRLSIKADDPADADSMRLKAKPVPSQEPVALDDPLSFPPPPPKPALVSRPKLTVKSTEAMPPPVANSTDAAVPFPTIPGLEKLPAVLNAPPPPFVKPGATNAESWPAVLDAPPPPGLAPLAIPGNSAGAEPAEIAVIRKASTFPFPAPTAKFPPLPGLANAPEAAPAEASGPEGLVKKVLLFGGIALVLLVGAGFAYFKFFYRSDAQPAPTPPPAAAKTPAAPSPAMEKIKKMVEKAEAEQFAPLNEAIAADPTSTPAPAKQPDVATPKAESAPAAVTPAPVVEATPPPVPVKPPPPPPSQAFKAWVINLKIRGVRGGDSQRVFIDRTSYAPGEVVNLQLGIMFAGYDEETRMLTFQDKTGATFERRH